MYLVGQRLDQMTLGQIQQECYVLHWSSGIANFFHNTSYPSMFNCPRRQRKEDGKKEVQLFLYFTPSFLNILFSVYSWTYACGLVSCNMAHLLAIIKLQSKKKSGEVFAGYKHLSFFPSAQKIITVRGPLCQSYQQVTIGQTVIVKLHENSKKQKNRKSQIKVID